MAVPGDDVVDGWTRVGERGGCCLVVDLVETSSGDERSSVIAERVSPSWGGERVRTTSN